MSDSVKLRCDMPGGYHGSRPGVRTVVRPGEVVSVPTPTADYLVSAFPAYWHRMETPRAAPEPPEVAPALHWRALVRGIDAGEFDDRLSALSGDHRKAIRKAAARRVEKIKG